MSKKIALMVDYEDLKNWCLTLMAKVGLPADDAEIFINALLDANLRGTDTHGLNYLPIYIKRINMGLIAKNGRIRILKESPCLALMDAGNKLGHIASYKAMQLAIEKATQIGIGVVGVTNSNHCGVLAYYTMMAVDSDCIGLAYTNCFATMAPLGGTIPFFGTNPISIAVPGGHEPPLVLDMSTSAQARAKIIAAAKKGEKIPLGWAVDANGKPTDDPNEAARGTVLPMAGHKGFGLAMMVNVLSGILTGAASCREVGAFLPADDPQRQNVGQLFQAIKIDSFVPAKEFKQRIDSMIREIRSSPLAPGMEEIRLPGDGSREHRQLRSLKGIPLSEYVAEGLKQLGAEYGVQWIY